MSGWRKQQILNHEKEKMMTSVKLAYCDYIAYLISTELKRIDTDSQKLLASVGRVQFDLGFHDEFMSTMKTIDVEDRFGKQYRITIQEL
jgi:hypothetical protein